MRKEEEDGKESATMQKENPSNTIDGVYFLRLMVLNFDVAVRFFFRFVCASPGDGAKRTFGRNRQSNKL
jgi:hypothetical protein